MEVSKLSFLQEYGPKLKEDYVMVKHLPKISRTNAETSGCLCFWSCCNNKWQKVRIQHQIWCTWGSCHSFPIYASPFVVDSLKKLELVCLLALILVINSWILEVLTKSNMHITVNLYSCKLLWPNVLLLWCAGELYFKIWEKGKSGIDVDMLY